MDADSAGNPHLSAVASIVTAAGASEHESGHCTEHLRSIGCKTGKFPQELVVLWLVEASETAWATLMYSALSLHARQHTWSVMQDLKPKDLCNFCLPRERPRVRSTADAILLYHTRQQVRKCQSSVAYLTAYRSSCAQPKYEEHSRAVPQWINIGKLGRYKYH